MNRFNYNWFTICIFHNSYSFFFCLFFVILGVYQAWIFTRLKNKPIPLELVREPLKNALLSFFPRLSLLSKTLCLPSDLGLGYGMGPPPGIIVICWKSLFRYSLWLIIWYLSSLITQVEKFEKNRLLNPKNETIILRVNAPFIYNCCISRIKKWAIKLRIPQSSRNALSCNSLRS